MNFNTGLGIKFNAPAARRHVVTGELERFHHFYLCDPATRKSYVARRFPDGRLECCNAADRPLNPRLDSAIIARIRAALDAGKVSS